MKATKKILTHRLCTEFSAKATQESLFIYFYNIVVILKKWLSEFNPVNVDS